MAGSAVRESVTLAGLAERARVARAFTGGVLGAGHPCQDAAVLLVSELFGNSVRHSASGAAGGRVTVAVTAGDWNWSRPWPPGGAGGGAAGGS